MIVNQIVFEEPLISESKKPHLRKLIYSTCLPLSPLIVAFTFFAYRDCVSHRRILFLFLIIVRFQLTPVLLSPFIRTY